MWSLARYWLSGPELPLQVGSCPNVTYTGLAAIMYRYSLQRHQSIPPPPEILLLITTINLHIQAFFFIFDPVKYSWFVATDGHDTPFWRPRRVLCWGSLQQARQEVLGGLHQGRVSSIHTCGIYKHVHLIIPSRTALDVSQLGVERQ